ncbi:MAG: beta-ketoacyl-ACP synthase II [Candidatus Omnitrophica bacterium]|nr:beta-ketoacyl-ACP synthase II [Candidatus Omnitrophota bacterium]
MENRVVVTGLGAITPLGNDVDSFWKNLIAGKSGVGRLTAIDPTNFDSKIAAEVKDFDPLQYGFTKKDLHRTERFVHFAIAATLEAINDAGLDLEKINREKVGVVVGSGIGSLRIMEEQTLLCYKSGPSRLTPFLIPSLIVNEAAGQIAIRWRFYGPNLCVTTACASATHSIGDAFRILQRGDAEVMIAGGTESCITALGIGGFCALKALSTRNDEPEKASRPFERDRDGFVMGEGSGIVVLETLEHAQKRKANIYCELVGYGASCDAYHITAPDPDGHGAALAMQWALRDARMNPEELTYINAHGTSTKLNDIVETMAIKRALGEYAKKVMVSSTKSMTGHLLGAAGGIEFVATCLAVKNDVVPPTINYDNPDPECDLDYVPNVARKVTVNAAASNSLGFGGHNATVVVKKFK